MPKTWVVTLDSVDSFCMHLTSYIQACKHAVVLRSHQIASPVFEGRYELLAGVHALQTCVAHSKQEIAQWVDHIETQKLFAMGYIAYEAGEHVPQTKAHGALAQWIVPEYRLQIPTHSRQLTIIGPRPRDLYKQILACKPVSESIQPAVFTPLTSQNEYLNTVQKIQNDILNGLYYELNYCIAFESRSVSASPYAIWDVIARKHPVPFSAFVKNNHEYLISCSPERFLLKHQDKLISQPIKGTAPRGANPTEDQSHIRALAQDPKERAENIMIVDLVRNDLCRICKTGSVQVEELLQVYTYPLVHQMISTVSGLLLPQKRLSSILEATFPMGSMTGAPKKMVISKINEYENVSRGPYSGSIGYLDGNTHFDLNVVIRTLVLNTHTQTASYHVGSAITLDSEPSKEYEECLLKAAFWQTLFCP